MQDRDSQFRIKGHPLDIADMQVMAGKFFPHDQHAESEKPAKRDELPWCFGVFDSGLDDERGYSSSDYYYLDKARTKLLNPKLPGIYKQLEFSTYDRDSSMSERVKYSQAVIPTLFVGGYSLYSDDDHFMECYFQAPGKKSASEVLDFEDRTVNAIEREVRQRLDQESEMDIGRPSWLTLAKAIAADDANAMMKHCKSPTDLIDGCWQPLHMAAFFGSPTCAKALIDAGADVHALTRNGVSVMDMATHVFTQDELCKDRTVEAIQAVVLKDQARVAGQHAIYDMLRHKDPQIIDTPLLAGVKGLDKANLIRLDDYLASWGMFDMGIGHRSEPKTFIENMHSNSHPDLIKEFLTRTKNSDHFEEYLKASMAMRISNDDYPMIKAHILENYSDTLFSWPKEQLQGIIDKLRLVENHQFLADKINAAWSAKAARDAVDEFRNLHSRSFKHQ